MTSITSACTCSVDGLSGHADTRYKGYSFTGCGAHVEYNYDLTQGAGYERTWCYVTSPDDCPGDDPYIPEGFKDDNTLPEWKAAGAAWKECYDGYRCEAWWGSLSGQPQGDPVVLNAPLDWPDCCALCSDTNNINSTTTTACAGWSFHPATGSCQLMSDVSLGHNVSAAWGVNGSVNGCGVITPSMKSGLLRELLHDDQSRLQKASCVEVSATKLLVSTGKGGPKYIDVYEGTFMTRDGALFVVSEGRGKAAAPPHSRSIEQKMLSVLYTNGLNPLANRRVAVRCRTAQGRRSEFLSLLRSVQWSSLAPTRLRVQANGSPHYDCLLLIGRNHSNEQQQQARKVLLVGVLGEDRLICVDAEILGFSIRGTRYASCTLVIAITLIIILCVALLTNEAAQVMAAWTFDGTDYRMGAVIGLVLCVSVPFALLAFVVYSKVTVSRLIQECPPATDESSESPPAQTSYRRYAVHRGRGAAAFFCGSKLEELSTSPKNRPQY